MKNILLILIFSMNTIASQLILKKGILTVSSIYSSDNIIKYLLKVLQSPFTISAILLQGIGYMVWILVLSRLKLGLAFAISGSFFYILLAAASWIIYKEKLNSIQWVGLIMITGGVLCMTLKFNFN